MANIQWSKIYSNVSTDIWSLSYALENTISRTYVRLYEEQLPIVIDYLLCS